MGRGQEPGDLGAYKAEVLKEGRGGISVPYDSNMSLCPFLQTVLEGEGSLSVTGRALPRRKKYR